MAGQTLTTLDAILKNIYLPVVRKQFPDNQILLKRLRRDSQNVSGRQAIIAVHYQGNEGVGARGEYDDLPAAGRQKYADLFVPMKNNYASIELSGQTIEATKDDKGSFIRAVQSEIKGAVNDLKRDVSRQLYGDGTGLLATCGTTTASNTVQLATDAKMLWLRVDMKVDILVKSTGTAVATQRTITAVDVVNKKITIDGAAVTTDSTHGVYRAGVYGKEIQGLAVVISDTGTYLGIDRATNNWWKANVFANGGTLRAISLDLMQQVEDAIDINGGNLSLLLTTHGVRRNYVALLQTERRIVNQMTLDGGFKAVEYNGLPLVVDANCPSNKIFFISEDSFAIYEMSDIDWMDKDGAILHRVPNKDAYEAKLRWYSELGCDACNKQGVLADITE